MKNRQHKVNYRAFGLILSSEITLPELLQIDGMVDVIDIEIVKGDLSKQWLECSNEGNPFVIDKGMVMFQLPNIAIFSIKEGCQITVSPLKDYEEDIARLWILGTCMGAILMQRKILPLHGSVVAIDGKAYAIVGDSGAGKSTLASAFLKKGFKLLTDDVIAVSFTDNNRPYVTPSYPQQKLWLKSLHHFGMDRVDYQPLIDREDKFAVPVLSQFADTPLALAGIFELVKKDIQEVEMLPIESLERIFRLYHHTYRNFFLERSGLMEWHFQTTSKLASKVDFYQLRRPAEKFTAHDLADLILRTLKVEKIINV
ncbi:aldolase [Niallia sp. XMNu-256]|uniref:aldolase n=1 Tax=Niallia sp. XMNu-256 TaxID=3082444 RepID=UPI0030D02BD7